MATPCFTAFSQMIGRPPTFPIHNHQVKSPPLAPHIISTTAPPYTTDKHRRWLHRTPPSVSITGRPLYAPSATLQLVSLQQRLMQIDEEVEELVGAIGDDLAPFELGGEMEVLGFDHVLLEALTLVDLIQRLGIQRYFEQQIQRILDSTNMQWNEKFGLNDAEITVLAFRLLRLHGYPVSAGFPYESKIMEEAEEFSRSQLGRALLESEPSTLQTNKLSIEIRFALEYPRQYLIPRLESRSIVRQLWPGKGCKGRCLELAKLDLDMLQKLHQQEIDELTQWWEAQGIKEVKFPRRGVLKGFFSAGATLYEPQFLAFREAFTTSGILAPLIDNVFDDPDADHRGLSQFNEAVQRWDPSLLDDFPQHKLVFTSFYGSVMEMAAEASKAQGRDLTPLVKSVWIDLIAAFAKESEWRFTKHIPTLEEYLKAACVTAAGSAVLWTSLFFMGEKMIMRDEVMQRVGKDSRFIYLVSLVCRLVNDMATFERERNDGELTSAVSCYMQDNPGCTQEAAIASLKDMLKSAFQELELELFNSRGVVPECCSRAILNFATTVCFLYKRIDGFNNDDREYGELAEDYFYGSLLL